MSSKAYGDKVQLSDNVWRRMTLGRRIAAARKRVAISQEQLGTACGVSRAAVGQWEKDTTEPTAAALRSMREALHVSVDWLLAGPGDQPLGASETGRAVPVLTFEQAPIWLETLGTGQPDLQTRYVVADRRAGPNSFALEIALDDMTPLLLPGDVIVVDPGASPRPGDIVLAWFALQGTVVRRYRPIGNDNVAELVPTNSFWPTLTLDSRTPSRLLATLVEIHRYRT